MEIQITGGYNSELNRVVLTKNIDIVYQGWPDSILDQKSEISNARDPLTNQWHIGDFNPATYSNGPVRSYKYFNGSKIGIGTSSTEYRLDIVGTLRAHEILVNTQKTADFVFEPEYDLQNLDIVKDL